MSVFSLFLFFVLLFFLVEVGEAFRFFSREN